MKWFTGIKNLNELKRKYKELAKKYHPDLHGTKTEKEMKEINAEFEYLFHQFKEAENKGKKEKEKETGNAKDFIEIILNTLNIKGVFVEINGNWVWVSGNTYPVKEDLKRLGFRWSKNKKEWYWFPNIQEQKYTPRYKGKSRQYRRNKYGQKVLIDNTEEER